MVNRITMVDRPIAKAKNEDEGGVGERVGPNRNREGRVQDGPLQ
jgi:hypothetical protein